MSALETGGDLDGDGREDLVVAWASEDIDGRVWILTDPAAASLEDACANAIAVGDLNGDGVDDLVLGGQVGRFGSETVKVLLGPLHSGTLTDGDVSVTWVGATLDSPPSSDDLGHAIELGDVDGDGDDDLLISAPMEDDGTYVPFGRVYLTLGPWSP